MFDPHSLDPSDKTDVKRRNVPSSILTLTGFPSTVLGIMPFDRLALQYVPLITWYVKTSEIKRGKSKRLKLNALQTATEFVVVTRCTCIKISFCFFYYDAAFNKNLKIRTCSR